MTINEFLENCQTDLTSLKIVRQDDELVYEGTVRSFKTPDKYSSDKIKLSDAEIRLISFYNEIVGFGSHSHWEPVIIITI